MINWPQIPRDLEDRTGMCFGCGKNNPAGLKLKFEWDGRTASAEFVPAETYQGWQEYVHGGILLCLLDEAMGYATSLGGVDCVTAKVEARLRQMARVDEPVVVTSSVTNRNRRLVEAEATVALKDGTIIAEGTATMFVVRQRKEPLKNVGA
jgi:acyl-coenzyme A thioesterase PaaI-like protein